MKNPGCWLHYAGFLGLLLCFPTLQLHAQAPATGVNAQPAGAAGYDGPAELPRLQVNSSLAATPVSGKMRTVKADGNLQQAINEAACGDTIQLQAGATFTGRFMLPAKQCDDSHWIILRTSASASALPPEGERLTPCYGGVAALPARPGFSCPAARNVLARLEYPGKGGSGPLTFATLASHYRLIGLEVTRSASVGVVYNLISLEPGAHHIVFDRMWIHGTAQDETTRGIALGGSTHVAVVDSYFSDFHCVAVSGSCTDSQAIAGGLGNHPMGPYRIENNYLEASGENILFGGGGAAVTPADIVIRRNHLFKPSTWMRGQPGFVGGADGRPFIVKNLFELKNAQRVLLEGNILENSWGGFSQAGFGMLITAKNQAIGGKNICPACMITDVTIRYCILSHVGGGMQIGNGLSDAGGAAQDGQRYSIHDVIVDDIDPELRSGHGNLFQFSTGFRAPMLQKIKVDHVTAFPPRVLFDVGNDVRSPKMADFVFTNNIVNGGDREIVSIGGGDRNCAGRVGQQDSRSILENCFQPFIFTRNAIVGGGSGWPKGNFFPKHAQAVGFVNYKDGRGGDYHLLPDSRYKKAGTDGKDLGADVDAIGAAVAGVR